MPYVYSTLTNDNSFASWVKQGDQQSIQRQVVIKGGIGLMNKNFITATGATVTEVTDEELAFLQTIPAFNDQVTAGFISFDKKKSDGEKVASSMSIGDGSEPITPADYAAGGKFENVVEAPTVTGGQ